MFPPPSSLFSCSDSSWGARSGSSRTKSGFFEGVWDQEFWVPKWPTLTWFGWHTCRCLHKKPRLALAILLYPCIHINAACGWWHEPIPFLGIVWEDAGSDPEFDNNDDGWYDWSLCYTQGCLWWRRLKLKDGRRPSYHFCFLFASN